MDEMDDLGEKNEKRPWWDKYGAWIILLVFLIVIVLRVLYLPPLPDRYAWSSGLFLLFLFAVIAYFSFRKPRD